MKRIAFVAHLSEVSGSGVALLATAAAFQSRGYKVYLVLPGNGPLVERSEKQGVSPVIIENPETALTEGSWFTRLKVVRGRLRYVQSLAKFLRHQHVDLVYVNSSNNIFPGLASRLKSKPVVWHIHETLSQQDPRARLKRRIIQQISRALIFASQSGLKSFAPPSSTPVLIARNQVDFQTLREIREARKHTEVVPMPSQVTLFMAGTVRAKGADVLIAAANTLKDMSSVTTVDLRIAGPAITDHAYQADLDRIIRSDQGAVAVTFTGLLDSLAPELEKVDLFISPSRNEALPTSIVEAMAAGVPVIATDVGDCADLLDHGRCGWVVPPENPQALAAAIREALLNPDLAREKADAAFDKVSRLYGSENFWQPLQQFVEDIINSNS